MPAADHGEAFGAVEEAGGSHFGDRLLPGIDQIRIGLTVIGEGTHAQHSVFRLQRHVQHVGNVLVATSVGMPIPRLT